MAKNDRVIARSPARRCKGRMQGAECPIGLRVIRNFGVIPGVMNCAVLHDAAFSSAQTRFRFRLSTDMPPVVANGGIAGGSHEHQANPGSTSRSASHTGEIEMALSAAKALGAHVQALFISQPPPVTRGGVTVS